MKVISAKLDKVAYTKEPVIAFRATSIKDSGTSAEQSVTRFAIFHACNSR